MADAIERRKREHIETVLGEDVAAKGVTTGFERFFFDHLALPELDLDSIDLSVELFGRRLAAPLLISSMTGGTARAEGINTHLARAAQRLGIAMGVGSQRAAIESAPLARSYQVRDAAPDILLFANLGAVQFARGYGVDEAKRAVEMIGADALILHLNPLQEAVQADGDRDWTGVARAIEQICGGLGTPIVVKEVGNGIGPTVLRRLVECGISAIDVSGAGGTSWSEVEAHRQPDPHIRRVAHAFAGWGVPTALALIEARRQAPFLPVFASGGIRSGVDAAKAVRLGATLVGAAQPVLAAATDAEDAAYHAMLAMVDELRIAAFCTGSADLAALRRARLRARDSWALLPTDPAGGWAGTDTG